MSRALVVSCLLSFLLFAPAVALAQAEARAVSVYGRAKKELEPDYYRIAIQVRSQGKTMAVTSDDYRKQLEKVRTVFNEMDFPEVKLVSKGKFFTDSPFSEPIEMQVMVMDVNDHGPAEKMFYIRERFDLEWRSPPGGAPADVENSLLGLLDRIQAEKIPFSTNESNPYYSFTNLVVGYSSKLGEEERALRAAAFQDAKAQAEELAALSGAKLGRVLGIEVSPPLDSFSGHSLPSAGVFPAESIDQNHCQPGGKIKLESIIRVQFELN